MDCQQTSKDSKFKKTVAGFVLLYNNVFCMATTRCLHLAVLYRMIAESAAKSVRLEHEAVKCCVFKTLVGAIDSTWLLVNG